MVANRKLNKQSTATYLLHMRIQTAAERLRIELVPGLGWGNDRYHRRGGRCSRCRIHDEVRAT
jgi:hypothetical protein